MNKVIMYSKNYCTYCHAAKDLLTRKNVEFEVVEIGGNDALRTEMMQRSGRHTVPQIFIGDHHVGGFDDLSAAERSGELDRLLAA